MTSTVLDVTVLLLCVSAGVVVLGNTGGGPEAGTAGGTAGDVADRLVTETATITYSVDGGARDAVADDERPTHEARTVHATLAELLAMTTANGSETGTETADRFRSRVLETVDDALDPRTRVDVRAGRTERQRSAGSRRDPSASGGGEGTTGSGSGFGRRTVSLGDEPPRNADVTTAVVTHPGPHGSRGPDVRIVVRAW